MKKVLIGLVIIIGMGLSACRNNLSEREIILSEFPSKYVKEEMNIEFDTDIIIPDNVEEHIFKSSAKKIEFQGEEIADFLFENETGKKDYERSGDNYISYNGESVYVGDAFVSYNSNSDMQKNLLSDFSLFQEDYTADQFEYVDIQKESAELEEKKVKDYIAKIDVKNCDFYRYYLLDCDAQTKYWLGTETFQGLPVFCPLFAKEICDTWAPIQVLSTGEEIEKIQILYYFLFDSSNEKIELRAFEDIANSLINEYKNILTDNKYLITKAQLIFWVDINQLDIEFNMRPVWALTVREYFDNDQTQYLEYQELIDAETATTIQVGG